ncbi:hypothetical protein GCM10007897_24130 [Sphingobium jiangsuense]|uniref:Uncharacterized protein n=1 Tax=Sphingobium jiangsuense TaxID=870476 RepID=A0A7W6BRS7_9SPHN|nr:hypothetical protein [Sphingobium jiangsuense]MBB3928612.1 hypothetical protein [Sphingobium jiangsuense]GLT01022.1 hypothetical protein GCM10007897_24130 [Sphingobium jiangsuense]
MADTYITTSFEIRISAEEAELLTECFTAADEIASDFPHVELSELAAAKACYEARSAAFKAAFPPVEGEEDPFAGFLTLWTDPEFSTFDAVLSIGDDPKGDGKLARIHGANADIWAIAGVIEKVCLTALPFGFTWAVTCSRMIPGSFSGGYFLITAEGIQGGSTGELMNEALVALRSGGIAARGARKQGAEDQQQFVLAVPDEEDGLVFWNNADGFGSLETATAFTEAERLTHDSLISSSKWLALPNHVVRPDDTD